MGLCMGLWTHRCGREDVCLGVRSECYLFQDVEGVAFGRLEAKFYCAHCTGLGGRPLAVAAFSSNKNQTVLKEQTVAFSPRLQAYKHSPVCTDGF